jgi:hypothetical protein
MEQRLGLVALCKVRHVYAADRLSVMLVNSAGKQMRDDLTVQLPVDANTIMRPGDPPLIVLKLFDPGAKDGHTSLAPGPCPEAANFTRRLIRKAAATMVHIPIPDRSTWLDGLTPGSIEIGDLLLLDRDPDPQSIALAMSGRWLSELLVGHEHAKARSTDAA